MKVSKCRSCKAEIVWMKTRNGKNVPVDVGSIMHKDATLFNPDTMVAHFATCADAELHRKKIKGEPV